MRACILIPPSPFMDSDMVFPHLGPYYIKRYVEEHSHHDVDVFTPADLILFGLCEYDIVGVSATTPQYSSVEYLQDLPSLVVLGGPHATHYDVAESRWSRVIRGDGCKPFLNILNGTDPGASWDDPDQLPHRDESFHDYRYYLDGHPTTTIMTSRGCPHRCAFCEHAGTALRLKSQFAVKRELQECVDLGFTGIMFFDDLFCLNLKRVSELCEVIKPFGIKFRCFAHARNFTPVMAEILSNAGCVEIGYGAESGSDKILTNIHKRTTVEQNYKIVETAHAHGIRVKAFLILGLPGESPETARQTEEFVLHSGVDDFDMTIYYPYRGTHIADHLEEYDLKVCPMYSEGWYKGRNGESECIVETSSLTRAEILEWRRRIYIHRRRLCV